ncbi:MAG: pilus assembly protein N-terminal domain-containing protein [Methylacidiphilales bacterium]|nr:pilus assembly protein N-terminal domain-containing protein [Candidatus Methylacidiphilales bacterium]
MKQPIPPHPIRSLILLGCLLALGCGLVRAQAPVAQRLDVYFGETTLLPIDGPIDSFNAVPNGIIKIDKSDASPNQLSIVGLAGGSTELTIKSGDRTLLFDVAVSPAPARIYINLNESKRLTFPGPIDDYSVSLPGIVQVVQPDISDNVLLVNALVAGKTTLTVTDKGQIYRYFISTFENRGADVLEIEDDFSAKGYRNLTIKFDHDQAILGGTVPTQEELDDAVRIVKQFTDYVNVKAQLGQEVEESEYTEQESIIINNIQRIANVKGLTVRVKFPMPTVITTSTYTNSIGDYIEPRTTTTPQGGTIRGSGFQPPTQQPNQTGGPLAPPKQENTTETTTTTENTTIPEKIFLYGDLQDDLDEAKVLRVARTFCPFIVNFMTVRDPIQVRTQIRFIQIQTTDTKTTGFDWSSGGSGPTITLGFGGTSFNMLPNPVSAFVSYITSPTGVEATVNAQAVFNLYETLGLSKVLREADIFLTNGQPGWYSEGEVESYVSAAVTTASSPPLTTLTASSVFIGVNMDISPLNLINAGGVEPAGQKIFGIPNSVGAGTSSGYELEQDSDPTAKKISNLPNPVQASGTLPFIDNTVKYVDENGLIGMNISTQLTLPDGSLTANKALIPGVPGATPAFIDLPNFFVRTTRTRVNLRDGQTVAIDGLIDKDVSTAINQIPFLSKVPLFSTFFKGHADENINEEVIVLVTPHIVRMRDPDSSRYPRPLFPELQDMAREAGDVPIIKPVRYDAQGIDLRPESPKDMKDEKNSASPNQPPPLAPHATGGMQTLQPPADSESAPAAPPAVDNAPPASDNSRQQPSGAPLAPTSTLP